MEQDRIAYDRGNFGGSGCFSGRSCPNLLVCFLYFIILPVTGIFQKEPLKKEKRKNRPGKREIFEETGIRVDSFIPNFRKQISIHYRRQDNVAHKRVIFFLAKTNETKVRISFEHSGYDWLAFEQLVRRLTFENAKNVLREANSFLTKEASSSQKSA